MKIKLDSDRLDAMAKEYLAGNYEPGYVFERIAKNNYAPSWELIIQSYKAGVYGLLAEIKKDSELRESIIKYSEKITP